MKEEGGGDCDADPAVSKTLWLSEGVNIRKSRKEACTSVYKLMCGCLYVCVCVCVFSLLIFDAFFKRLSKVKEWGGVR